jgi:hypothetical protein
VGVSGGIWFDVDAILIVNYKCNAGGGGGTGNRFYKILDVIR